jgi:hypothetical protein
VAKKQADVQIYSHGIYDGWDKHSRAIPTLAKMTTEVPAVLGVEFGFILKVRGGRGKFIDFCIDHPPFQNDGGEIALPFEGREFIKGSDFQFFLGDTIWAPVDDKVGDWTITCWIEGEQVAEKTFRLHQFNESGEA